MVVTCYFKLFCTGTDRHNDILISLLLLVVKTKKKLIYYGIASITTMKFLTNQNILIVITRCRVLYEKYFPSFSYFATYFTSLLAHEIIVKYEKRRKQLPILHKATCNNYCIVKCFLKRSIAKVFLFTC